MVPRSFITLLLRYLVLVSSLISILADENSGTSKLQIQVCFVLIDLMSSCGSFLFSSPFTTFIIALLVGILLHFTALYCTVLCSLYCRYHRICERKVGTSIGKLSLDYHRMGVQQNKIFFTPMPICAMAIRIFLEEDIPFVKTMKQVLWNLGSRRLS